MNDIFSSFMILQDFHRQVFLTLILGTKVVKFGQK